MERDMSEDMAYAIRLAHRIVNHAKVDRQFQRNAVIRQKLFGVAICAVAIVSQIVIDDIWWALETIPLVTLGLMLFNE